MSGSIRLLLTLLVAVFAIYFAYKIVTLLVAKLIGMVLSMMVPVLLIIGICAALFFVVNRKALAGGRKILP